MLRKPNYDKKPYIQVDGNNDRIFCGYEEICLKIYQEIKRKDQVKFIIAIDAYQGVNLEPLVNNLLIRLNQYTENSVSIIDMSRALKKSEDIDDYFKGNITEDRIFGVLSTHKLIEFFDKKVLKQIEDEVYAIKNDIVIIFGMGASFVGKYDLLIYGDMPRWEIQNRMRMNQVTNIGSKDFELDFHRKYKRAFFLDWRVLDRHKQAIIHLSDYILDTVIEKSPKMIPLKGLMDGLQIAIHQPFRVVPFFDPGPWGGQWMKEVCDLDQSKENFAWCFDCVPEENSLNLKFGNEIFEIPSINLVFEYPKELLGEKVYARFGTEFPIRFDFLDTMEGGNLSLQVHPLTEYIQQEFGMHYTQDESYYFLDAKEDAHVYLGVKENIQPELMINSLEVAQKGDGAFDADHFVNKFSVKKHDHILIPAGTVHCSGKNAMVLEISSTPYIFTFKLWDWGRLGTDGLPRPINIAHGKNVIQWDRDTAWVEKNLINHVEVISQGAGWIEERTGLHELEFIETRRHWFEKQVEHDTNGSVNVLNLIQGEEAIVKSPSNRFEPFVVHYAETFIIPANIGLYSIAPYGLSEGQQIATIKAYVRI
ncbi:MAG: mannose-6-phosphate isomerase [Firmicutes bacterium HGW-Firmicutes-7]|nr:MAG: mannose-6-phosphate isomerase [Firmicutes bacterium HGW-Firmicutes-7]